MSLVGEESSEVVMVEKYNVSLILLFAMDVWFRAILDEIRVWVYSVLIGPSVISLRNRLILVTYRRTGFNCEYLLIANCECSYVRI